nr:uncharacterized protein LOC109746050 [Aegilops tauschii subsp. strangulata]
MSTDAPFFSFPCSSRFPLSEPSVFCPSAVGAGTPWPEARQAPWPPKELRRLAESSPPPLPCVARRQPGARHGCPQLPRRRLHQAELGDGRIRPPAPIPVVPARNPSTKVRRRSLQRASPASASPATSSSHCIVSHLRPLTASTFHVGPASPASSKAQPASPPDLACSRSAPAAATDLGLSPCFGFVPEL